MGRNRRPTGRMPSATSACLGWLRSSTHPRPEVAEAVARCHAAGIRIIVVTGDYGLTAREIARRVGIGRTAAVITGDELEAMSEDELDQSSARTRSRSSRAPHRRRSSASPTPFAPGSRHRDDRGRRQRRPRTSTRRHRGGHGPGGTDVAREAATMVLTDDNFATIVAAIGAGRRVFDNVRKFIVYIFAHATPEVIPFLVFALSGGAIPLPLTVLQILAIDLGTEILPALALGREPAEPDVMERKPRPPKKASSNGRCSPVRGSSWG